MKPESGQVKYLQEVGIFSTAAMREHNPRTRLPLYRLHHMGQCHLLGIHAGFVSIRRQQAHAAQVSGPAR
jgi:hypothetical protein